MLDFYKKQLEEKGISLGKRRKKNSRDEMNLQIAVADYLRRQIPEILFTISPQGMKLPIWIATSLKKMGYRKGTSDILILEPNGKYYGLFLELKKNKKQKATDEQIRFIKDSHARGYYATVCADFYTAKNVIDTYMREKYLNQHRSL